jgi:inosine/xanthosine triphosphate pyrophosphatase family protein
MTSVIQSVGKSLKNLVNISPKLPQNVVLDKVSRLSEVIMNPKTPAEKKEAAAKLKHYKKKYGKNPVVIDSIVKAQRLGVIPGAWSASTKRAHSSSRKGGAKRKTRRQ